MPESQPEVFFHAGLERTATTYLQKEVFPKLKGVRYIQKAMYFRCNEIIDNSDDKYLITHEWDKTLEQEVERICSLFPDVKIILVLRRHDSWLASQYKRRVKNGYDKDIRRLFDPESGTGVYNKEELQFYARIKHIEQVAPNKPLILFYEDLRKNPYYFFDRLAEFLGASYDKSEIPLSARHQSYDEKQLKVLKSVNKKVRSSPLRNTKNQVWNKIFKKWFEKPLRYSVLHMASFIPHSALPEESLIPTQYLQKVRDLYAHDWQRCIEYTKKYG